MNAPQEPKLSVPPHSIEAEQSVLGALMIDNDAFDRVAATLRAEHFYRYDHRVIYETVTRLIAASRPADVITVFESLQAKGKDEAVGGLPYLNTLSLNVPGSANIHRYAQMVIERAMLRGLISALDVGQAEAFQPKGKAAEEIVTSVQTALERLTDQREHEPVDIRTALSQVVTDIDEQYHGRGVKAISTGHRDLDHRLGGGMSGGDLIVVAGRPAMGKSAFSQGIGEHVAEQLGLPVAIFSAEMPTKQIAQRALSRISNIPFPRIRDGSQFQKEDWPLLTAGVQRIAEMPMFIDEMAAPSLGYIAARARSIKRKSGLGLVIIDYLQLMSASEGENRTQQIGANSRGLKALAKQLDCPIILLSQLNRGLENRQNKRPMMSDLRESGDIEQDADVILFVYRDEVYNPESMDRGIAEIIIGKQRNGEPGKIGLQFTGDRMRFSDLAYGSKFGEAVERKPVRRGFSE